MDTSKASDGNFLPEQKNVCFFKLSIFLKEPEDEGGLLLFSGERERGLSQGRQLPAHARKTGGDERAKIQTGFRK